MRNNMEALVYPRQSQDGIKCYFPKTVAVPENAVRQVIQPPIKEVKNRQFEEKINFGSLKYIKKKNIQLKNPSYEIKISHKIIQKYISAPEFTPISSHIEKIIKKHSGEITNSEIIDLFKDNKQMASLVELSIDSLVRANKILIDQNGDICWIHNPSLFEKYSKDLTLRV
jgi:hypothetical protein